MNGYSMRKASDARETANEQNYPKYEKLIKEVSVVIEKASNQGEYHCEVEGSLPSFVQFFLEDNGYKITQVGSEESIFHKTKISW